MKYFFQLGTNPTLSTAEIISVFYDAKNFEIINKDILIMEIENEFNSQDAIKKLGGTIKIGKILESSNRNNLLENIKKILNPKEGKFHFGISFFGKGQFNTKKLGMEIKKYLREKNISCRFVTSREKTLSSVVVEQNKLLRNGIEIIIIESEIRESRFLVGQTLSVQPFKELSKRDYGRPARDDQSGMLPPKLAQIMINLSLSPSPYQGGGGGEVILDPFCGSGTILTEAMLMGYKNLIGSDISEKATEDTKQNLEWIKEKYESQNTSYKIYKESATELSKILKLNSIDAIVTEPYLGPQRGKVNIQKTIKELEKLYSDALFEFKKVLKLNGKVVMVLPLLRTSYQMNPNLYGFKIVNPILENLRNNKNIKLTNRNTIIYGREGQRVWREILILQK